MAYLEILSYARKGIAAEIDKHHSPRQPRIRHALGEDVHAAVASNMTDFEDALVASIVERCQMEYIITRNTKDYAESPVKAIAPEDFLKL